MKLSAPSVRVPLLASGVAVLAGLVALWRGGSQPAPAPDTERGALLPTTIVGTNALSHGGPAATRQGSGQGLDPLAPLTVGQRVTIGARLGSSELRPSEIPSLSTPLDQAASTALATRGNGRKVLAGTEATVTAIPEPRQSKAGEERRFVQVRQPDGTTG